MHATLIQKQQHKILDLYREWARQYWGRWVIYLTWNMFHNILRTLITATNMLSNSGLLEKSLGKAFS